MKQNVFVVALCLVLLCILSAGCTTSEKPGNTTTVTASPDELTFITEEYPPFNYQENGVPKGIAVDLLIGAYKEMGTPVSPGRIQVLPWHVGYNTALSKNNTVLFGMQRLPEREKLFKWAGPFASERMVLFADRGKGITIAGPEDLNKYRIGVVRDDTATAQLTSLGVHSSNLIAAESVPQLIALMQEGNIDLWCYGRFAGQQFAKKSTGNADYFDVVYALDTIDIYYAFNNQTPDTVVESFQKSLDTLRLQPDPTGVTEYQRVMYRYVNASCMSHPPVTAGQVRDLVNVTAGAMAKDAPGTIEKINAGEHPFWDRQNRALYTFVYTPNVTIIAEADNPRLVGVNMKGKTDVAGTAFRDQITDNAMTKGTGWVDYVWIIPEDNGIYHKSAYFRLVNGSDHQQYVVVSGMYSACS
jgi:polar amino acid transport system substrate-binding protein